jgi:hypothetical protein
MAPQRGPAQVSLAARLGSLGGTASTYLQEPANRRLARLSSFSLYAFAPPPAAHRLPAHLEKRVFDNAELCELKAEIEDSKQAGGRPGLLSRAKQRYTNNLKKLKLEALRQYQQHWVRERHVWKILTRGKVTEQDRSKTDFVENLSLLIPERGRLAEKMVVDRPLEPAKMWQALQDLFSLFVQDLTVLDRPLSAAIATC